MRRLATGLVAACLACGAATPKPGPRAPAWTVTGESPEYPRDSFVIGLGRGSCQEAADAAARAEIAKVFEVRVTESTEQTATYSAVATGLTEVWQRSADVAQAVRTEASRVLAGVEIVARHRDADGHFALAVLSRRKVSDDLHARATALAQRAASLASLAAQEKDPLAAARAWYQAMLALVRLDVLNQDLGALGLRPPVTPPMRVADARSAFVERVRSGVRFGLDVSGDDSARLQTALASALTAAGVPVAEGDRARVVVRGRASMRRTDRPPREWVFVRYDVELQARDTVTDSIFASVGPISDDASGQTEAQAFERADYLVRSRHVEPFVRTLLDRLFGAGESEERR